MSTLRSYGPAELRDIAESVNVDGCTWEVGALQGRAPIPVIYVRGLPGGAGPR